MSNIKNDISKDKDFQEQLKKFKEEAKKIENSEALLQAREKFNKIEQQTKNAAFNTKDIISDIYDIFLKKNEQLRQSQFVKAPVDKLTTASTQILKKINADKLISSAKNLSDTLVSDSQGSLRYSVYKSPTNLEKRDVKEAQKNSECQENKNETRLEMHKDSKWQNSWEKFKNSNPAFSRLFRIIEIANSSKFFQKTNIITKKITNFITNLNSKTEIQTVVNELHQLDDTFSITSFLFYCETSFVPNVLESWMGGHSEILKDWCHEAVFNILTEPINQAKKRSAYWDNRIIDVSEIELVGAKMMEQGPVLIISFYSQQISCLRKVQSHELIDGDPDKVQKIANIWALCRDREVFGNNEAWKLIDANSSSCGDSWV